jgi:hypothetical protein
VLPEGTFVSALPGKLIRGSSGEIVFVPASGASNVTSAPMMLLRCQKLAQIVSAWSGDVVGESSVGATISGQVFSYGSRAYLMPTVFALGLAMEESPTIAEPKSAERAKPKTPEPVRGDADPKALIEKLESRPRPRRAVDRVRTSSAEIAAVTPAASTMVTPSATSAKPTRVAASLIPEGTVLTARRGRLVRSGQDSELSFAADNGPEDHGQGPMALLACRVTERMEGAAAAYGDNIALKVSGRVTIYQGRNYLMPTMYQLVKAGDVVPQQ